METDTTPQPADNALQQQAATTTDTTTTPMEAAPSTNQRPDFIPEKFWDAQKGEAKIDQLAISYANLEKAFSSKSQAPKKPGADASPEDQAKYFAELRKFTGAPEKPEDYGIKAPEGKDLAPIAGDFSKLAHEYSAAPEFVHKAVDLYNKAMEELVSNSEKYQESAFKEQVVDALTNEWGQDAVSNWQAIDRGTGIGGVDKTALDPGEGLKAQRELAKLTLFVDQLHRDDKGLISSDSQATYKEQIERLQKSDDWWGKNGPEAQMKAQERLKGLFDASQK